MHKKLNISSRILSALVSLHLASPAFGCGVFSVSVCSVLYVTWDFFPCNTRAIFSTQVLSFDV